MAVSIGRPKLEGNIAVGDDRQIGFAEFGDPQGRAISWLHGTPGGPQADSDGGPCLGRGQHVVSRLPGAELYHLPGESHLAGLGRAQEILGTVIEAWDRYGDK